VAFYLSHARKVKIANLPSLGYLYKFFGDSSLLCELKSKRCYYFCSTSP